LSDQVLKYFETVLRDSNTTCAAALKRLMRVVVDDITTSYLFVGTPELKILLALMFSPCVPRPSSTAQAAFGGCSRSTFAIRSRPADTIRRCSIALPSTLPITWRVRKIEHSGRVQE
jgi:hypothetical protein